MGCSNPQPEAKSFLSWGLTMWSSCGASGWWEGYELLRSGSGVGFAGEMTGLAEKARPPQGEWDGWGCDAGHRGPCGIAQAIAGRILAHVAKRCALPEAKIPTAKGPNSWATEQQTTGVARCWGIAGGERGIVPPLRGGYNWDAATPSRKLKASLAGG